MAADLFGFNPLHTFTATELSTGGKGVKQGVVAEDQDGKQYIFAVTTSAFTVGLVAHLTGIAGAVSAALLTTTVAARGNRVGVAMTTIASGSYGWFQIYGPCTAITTLASAAANVRLNTTATTGSPDDDGTSTTKQIEGLYLTVANAASTGNAVGILNFPTVGVTL